MRIRTLRDAGAGAGSHRPRCLARDLHQSLGDRQLVHLERPGRRAARCPGRPTTADRSEHSRGRSRSPMSRRITLAADRPAEAMPRSSVRERIEHEQTPTRAPRQRDPRDPPRPLRPRSGSRASRPGWAGCSTAWTCTSTPWSRRRSSPSCWPSPTRAIPRVGWYSSLIQAAFLLGWALGGGFFGRIGDRLGRSRALSLTILTYALFTGLSSFAQTWWHLLIFRFLAALGIGGEWAVGASLLSETWPRRWRPWIAAVAPDRRQRGRPAGRDHHVPARRLEPPRASSWSAFCPRCWCSGFAARCPSPRSGTGPERQAGAVESADPRPVPPGTPPA